MEHLLPQHDDTVARLVESYRLGESGAMERLFDHVYAELKVLARSRMKRERKDHTWRPTELVHEAFIRLANVGEPDWDTRQHFFAAAALAMRRILVDHARFSGASKRGAGWRRAESCGDLPSEPNGSIDLLAIDDALNELEKIDSRKAKLVELRFFTGLALSDVAKHLGISLATAKRDWAFSKAWLFGKLRDSFENAD